MRLLWREEVGRVDDPSSLVFVDEMGTHTSLGPLYAYAPIGERAFFEVPRNRGKNTTLLASLDRGDGSSVGGRGCRRRAGGYFAHCGYRTPAQQL